MRGSSEEYEDLGKRSKIQNLSGSIGHVHSKYIDNSSIFVYDFLYYLVIGFLIIDKKIE